MVMLLKELPFKVGDVLINTQALTGKVAIILKIEMFEGTSEVFNRYYISYFYPGVKNPKFRFVYKCYTTFTDLKRVLNNAMIL